MDKKEKVKRSYYHPPFVSAMHIELRENNDSLLYEDEHRLNTDPLLIDLLIIKKSDSVNISSGLGKIFRKVNIWEYKSPDTSLGYKEFHKGLTYAHLYVASSPESISYNDITISFLRHSKPIKLMKKIISEGYKISEYEPGIFHVFSNEGQPQIQIIVSRMLGKKYGWLRSLNNTTDTKELKKLATEAMSFGLAEKHYASHALDFIYSITNPNDHKEDNDMGIFTDYFNKLEEQEERLKNQDEQIKNRDEQIKNQDEQIKNQDEQIKDLKKQLKRSDKENSDLKKRLQAIEKKLTNIAVL